MNDTQRGTQGRKGDQGERGEPGKAALSPSVRRALVFLFALSLIISVGDLFWNAHQVNASRAANHRQNEITERKICTAISGLVVLKPPPGDPASNPSRAYLQGLHVRFTQISGALGCNRKENP